MLWPNVFKTVSFSSYFHLIYSLFSQILCYTNSLTFQDLLSSKHYITDIVRGKFDDNRPRSTSGLFFVILSCYFVVILFKWLLMRNLATILPLKSKLSGKFQRFNSIDGRIAMLKGVWLNFQYCITFYETQTTSRLKEII